MRVKLGLNCRLCCEISFTETLMMDHGVVSPLEYIRIQKLFNLRFPIIIVILKQWSISKLINLLINCLIGYFNKGRSDFNPSFFYDILELNSDEFSNTSRKFKLSWWPCSVLEAYKWKSQSVGAVLPRLYSRPENQYLPHKVWWETWHSLYH